MVGLTGELGAGKTCFVRGVARGADVAPQTYVSSPTFTLVNEYPGRVLVVHIDLYRIGDVEELVELGFDHYLGGEGACLIEWYDRFFTHGESDPAGVSALAVSFAVVDDDTRRIEVAAGRERRCRQLAAQWQRGLAGSSQ